VFSIYGGTTIDTPVPRRIIMTADTIGGVWTYALELIQGLLPHGVEVVLATMGAPLSRSQREEVAGIRNLTIAESCYKLEWMPDPWTDVARAGEWLRKCAANFDADFAHINGYAHAALDWDIPVVVVAHSCVLSWWRAVKGEAAPANWRCYAGMVERGLREAHEIVAPTHAMLRALKANYCIEHGRVIPNGRSSREFPPGVKEHFIFSAGRLWDEAKNVGALERAAAGLCWPVFVAGEERCPSGDALQLKNVATLGQLSPGAMSQWLKRASIFAAPARYEPFGLSILEAALSGCALVLGDIDSLRELWDGAAVFVPPDDSERLAAVLNWIASQSTIRQDLARRATARAQQYSRHAMSARYLQIYGAAMTLCTGSEKEASCES
jgi:glycogen(starch) synthase